MYIGGAMLGGLLAGILYNCHENLFLNSAEARKEADEKTFVTSLNQKSRDSY